MFDRAAAARFAEQDDRDEAWFFAGRETERQAFAAAARQAYGSATDGGRPRAIFRIFQGAPGCGKTSFVRRMETERRDILFVLADEQHLTNAETLMRRIAQEALDQRKGANIVSGLAVAALEASRMRSADDAVTREAGNRAARQTGLVVWVDEAQTLDASCKALASAHKGGLGIPALVVLSGLPTTARRIRAIPGLSRLADAAVVDMGVMADAECAASTRMMLDAFGASATNDAPSRVASMAFGWPQHLKGAQKALATALLRTDGNLGRVDMAAVARESDARRAAYYGQRLDNGLPADEPALAVAIIAKIGTGHIAGDLSSMVDLVRDQAKATGSPIRSRKDATAVLDDMVQHGILVRRRSPEDILVDHWTVAVPSMAAWAADAAARHATRR